MMKKTKKILVIASLLVIGSFSYGIYLFNKPTKQIENEKPDLIFKATELVTTFNNSSQLTSKLINKIIEVTGKVSMLENNVESKIIILNNGIKCELVDLTANLKKDQLVTIKGICSGYDDMFNELSLTKCHIIQ